MTILPYLPAPSPPITGATAAQHLDAVALDAFPPLDAFVRLPVEGEFDDAPDGLRLALEIAPMAPAEAPEGIHTIGKGDDSSPWRRKAE